MASTLPRSYEAVVRDRLRFRVGRIVYVAFSHDETIMGFAFPKEERDALVASEPDKFLLPRQSELRYNWVCVRLDAIDHDELRRARPRRVADVRPQEDRGCIRRLNGASDRDRASYLLVHAGVGRGVMDVRIPRTLSLEFADVAVDIESSDAAALEWLAEFLDTVVDTHRPRRGLAGAGSPCRRVQYRAR